MDCERFDKVVLSLLYEETDDVTAASARRHLHHCSRCQSVHNQLRATKDITELPLEAPPSDLFESVLEAERKAQAELPLRERLSRIVSITGDYAMRPQLAMAAVLLLMIGSSLLFVRNDPLERDKVRVTELGAPHKSTPAAPRRHSEPQVFPGDATEHKALERDLEESEESVAPRATYQDALSAYHEGRYAEAERLFAEVAAAGGEKAAAAALHEGHAARNGSGCQRASGLYDDIADRYRGTTISDEAAWHAATCYQAMGQLERARSHYDRLSRTAAFGERAKKALASLPLGEGSETQLASSKTEEGAEALATASRSAAAPAPSSPAAEAEASPAVEDGATDQEGSGEKAADPARNVAGKAKPTARPTAKPTTSSAPTSSP